MFIQTQKTPNPNSLKFLPGIKISNIDSAEFKNKDETNNILIRNILSITGVESIFLGTDFLSVNKSENTDWEDIKHIVLSLMNEFFGRGNKLIIDKNINHNNQENYQDIEKKIVNILETKVKPAVANDGGDIKFLNYKDGIVKVKLQGSCSGCPSSTITLKRGVQNLLQHYIPEIKQVEAD
ncbi:NifU family protein [Candidatus Pelagibacter sp.]|nr:NifU family protein [Candidatus Pelagibacter sp.]